MALKKTLTIAGSDTSAGAGMQADLKTFQELETYGIVALTSIVTMDKATWSHDVTPIPFDVFEKQLETAISRKLSHVLDSVRDMDLDLI